MIYGNITKEQANKYLKYMEKELKIVPPDGYEVDTENSTFECIKFKPILNYLDIIKSLPCNSYTINVGNNKETVIFSTCINKLLAINSLMNIAKYYNGDWEPNWENEKETKYFIYYSPIDNEYKIDYNSRYCNSIVYFKTYKDAKAVIDNPNFRKILDTIYK